MTSSVTPGPARAAAGFIERAWIAHVEDFHRLTCRARDRFGARDWSGTQEDAAARLDLYNQSVDAVIAELQALLGDALRAKGTWVGLKREYVALVAARADAELAETFFNSITRRIFVTVGVDPQIEFVTTALEFPVGPRIDHESVTVTTPVGDSLEQGVARVLGSFAGSAPFEHLSRDIRQVTDALVELAAGHVVTALEFARAPFFRHKEAYLVGRAHTLASDLPVAIAVLNAPGGLRVDAVLTEADDISIVFSFARSYFMVETPCPAALVAFLRELMPRKPLSELYASIGHNRHGKTELYRALLGYLANSDDIFDIAPGARGMVMVVFTLPGFDVVFKIIRDRFEPPKTTTREGVREKYRLVFRHDRAGRLVDAQEFEHLQFDRTRFAPALLEEFAAKAAGTVEITETTVHFTHLYTERRLTPLDLYVRTAPPGLARAAVLDYGQALRELAASNVFPGDLLLKNFGVSRHGRVIFYDYDELALLSECRFRRLPPARDLDDEVSSEPWFHVDENDIFPEEFLTFLGLPDGLRHLFVQEHGELLAPGFWVAMQDEHKAGRLPDVWPYPASKRLRR